MKTFHSFIILIPMIWLSSCHSDQSEHHHPDRTFAVTSPIQMDTSITQEYVCQVHAIQHIELRALESGYLQDIYVDEGQYVRKGQLMFQVMPLIYEAEVQMAQAEAHFTEIEFQNIKLLADSGIVSPNELALARAKLDKANAEVALANAHLSFTEIRAPFSGLMDHFHVRLGSLLEEGELLTTLSDNSEMWVYFNVPEAEYLEYQSSVKNDSANTVRLRLANHKVFGHEGKVTAIEADFNSHTGNIAFRATFPNPEGLLRHGQTGNILMDVPLPDALLIPQKTTYEVLDRKYVFVVDEDNIIRSRKITIGAEMPHVYAVTTGLEPSDKVLLEGLRLVKEKDQINYKFHDPDSVLSHLDLYAE